MAAARPSCASIAAAAGDTQALAALLDGADRDSLASQDPLVGGATPLHIAARRGHGAATIWLLDNGARVSAADQSGATPLACAAASEDLPTFRAVLAAAVSAESETHAPDAEGLTPLHEAAGSANLDMVQLLLGASADPNASAAGTHATPLHVCAAASRSGAAAAAAAECAACLAAAAGCSVAEKRTATGQSALELALATKSWAVAAAIIAHDGTPVDSIQCGGRTMLHNAALVGDANSVASILGRGASPVRQDDGGRTPLHEAAAYGDMRCVRILLDSITASSASEGEQTSCAGEGASCHTVIDAIDEGGSTALHAAAIGQHRAVMGLLLEYGASTAIADGAGQLASDYCAPEPTPESTTTVPVPAVAKQPPVQGEATGLVMARMCLLEEDAWLKHQLRSLKATAAADAASTANPTPTQLASFLGRLTGRLGECVTIGGKVPTAVSDKWRAQLAAVGWAVQGNKAVEGTSPPAAEDVQRLLSALIASCAPTKGAVAV